MTGFTAAIVTLSFCLPPAMLTLAASTADSISSQDAAAVRIEIAETRVTGRYFEIEYEIINDSEYDAWILTDISPTYLGIPQYARPRMDAEMFIGEDDRTLVIRRRLDAAERRLGREYAGRYVRLRAGRSQTEWIFFELPSKHHPLGREPRIMDLSPDHTVRMVIEIGYCLGYPLRTRLPETLSRAFRHQYGKSPEEEAERHDGPSRSDSPFASKSFIGWGDRLACIDEEYMVLQPWVSRERVLKKVLDGLRFQQVDDPDQWNKIAPSTLSSYERVEIKFQPSALEYFFPSDFQQSLLTPDELKQINSQKVFVEKDTLQASDIEDGIWEVFADRKPMGHVWTVAMRCRSRLNVVFLIKRRRPHFPCIGNEID
ncbi:MAG TPA: hypothetical protein ENI81_11770 [Phycisphaerales bacterium]|nr:hypothetical protein [Phycisphaerales bacterium]